MDEAEGRKEGAHPDGGALEAVRTGEGDPASAAHATACPACARRLAELERLAAALREGAAGAAPAVGRETEARILEFAARREREIAAAGRSRRRVLRLPRLIPAAAAALVLAAAGVSLFVSSPRRGVPGDLDRSGRVDIVDAYLLDRRLRAGIEAPPSCDLNGDGRLDAADVAALARRAVALGPGGA